MAKLSWNTLGGEGFDGVGAGVRSTMLVIWIGAPLGPVKLSISAVVKVVGSTAPLNVTVTEETEVPGVVGTSDWITGPETRLNGLLFGKRMAKSPRP